MKSLRSVARSITGGTLKVFIVTIILSSFSFFADLNAQQKATRQTAMNAFTGSDFELAYVQYSELSAQFPKDPLYKYYRGVCLVKLERESLNAVNLLQESINESAAIRPVPADAMFYLGRARHMSGDFASAVKSYATFTEQAGRKASRDLNVAELIKQCEAGKGSVTAATTGKMEIEPSNVTMIAAQEPANKALTGDHENLPESYENILSEALAFQKRSDSAMAVAAGYRDDLEKAEGTAKSGLWTKIQESEKQAAYYRSLADQKMAEAGKLAGFSEPVKQDTAPGPEPVKSVVVVQKEAIDTLRPPVKEVFSEFNITGKPVYKPDEKVAVNPQVPPGLIYRIQVAVFRNPVAPSYFKGISPINGFRNDATGITTFYAGLFRKSADASKALPRVKSLGFKDAFVVALMDKKSVSADRAAVLEKEWGAKPLYTTKSGPESLRDTVPQTLVFRVEVKRSPKPLPKDQVEGMTKMAGARGFDIIVTEKKQNVYLIGTFLTYKSASEFTDLIIRNGYRDSKVVAYLGKREIPVETARKLFDEY